MFSSNNDQSLTQEKPPPVENLLKKVFLNWSRHVDINGYNKIFEYKNNLGVQLIWIFILVMSTGATFWIISKNIMAYLNYDMSSQIDIINEMPAIFPTITICSNDPFTSKYAENFYDNFLNQSGYKLASKFIVDTNLNNLVLMQVSTPSFSDENRKKLGFDRSVILSCKFKKKHCENDMHWYWSYTYGNCWQFNSGFNLTNQKLDIKTSSVEGRDDGLNIGIFPLVDNNQYMVTWEYGMIVFIHNNQFKPLLTDAVYIEYGKTSFISIKRTITHKTPLPYSNCIDLSTYSSRLYSFIVDSGQAYRQNDCFKLCQQEQIIAKCGCYNLEFPMINNQTMPCLNLTQFNCLDNEKSNFDLTECQANFCPLECDSIKYDLTLSTLVNPGLKEFYTLTNQAIQSYSQMLGQNLTYELFQSMWLNVKVYYPSLEYTQINETPKTTIFDLFTQIGGSLSLFISFSVYTLFELTEMLILILHAWTRQKMNVAQPDFVTEREKVYPD